MPVISKSELLAQKAGYFNLIKSGSLFIYPTDTIYGIGCNALINSSVKKLRELKGRSTTPFSIIAPSKEWIKSNCIVPKQAEEWLDKLPGPYTFIFRLKDPSFFSQDVAPGSECIGVRIPKHWISDIVHDLGYPIITTSVNVHGGSFMTSMETLDKTFERAVDLTIYEGEKNGIPSQVFHFEGAAVKQIR